MDANLSPSIPEAPDQVAVVRGQIDLFDFSIIDEVVEAGLRLNGQPPDAGDSSVWAISHCAHAPRIRAMGLIDSTGGWMLQGTPGPVHERPVEWAVPGPEEGPYASYTRLRYIDAECPKRVPLLMEFTPHDDAEIHAFSERALWDGLSADLVTNPLGWVKVRASRWRGELVDAFPQRDVAHLLSSPEPYLASWGALLPLVLGPGVLNADALGTMVLVLPTQQFLKLRDQILGAGTTLTARWCGEMAFRQAWKPAIVSETSSLQVQTGANEASLERMRANWELGVVFREAREQWWLHHLPPIDHPWRSHVYRALRDMLPGIAAQGRAEAWTDPERAETMDRILNIVLECCFAEQLARERPRTYYGDRQKAIVNGVTNGPENVLEHVLGPGWTDPWSYYLLDGPNRDTLADIAERYERIPGMWSPAVSRVLVHALLLAETSDYLKSTSSLAGLEERDRPVLWAWGPGVNIVASGLTQLRNQRERALRRSAWAWWRRAGSWIAITAVAGFLGVLVGEYKGPILGVIAGVISFLLSSFAIAEESRNDRVLGLNDQMAAGLSLKMQLAIRALADSDSDVSWNQAERTMEAAAAAGAVWPAAAWRLVEQARNCEVTARAG